MLPEYTKKANLRIGIGMGLVVVGLIGVGVTNDRFDGPNPVALGIAAVLWLIGYPLFVWGCCEYCQAKRQHWALGFLGILGLLGLIVLVRLPDNARAMAYPPGYYPPQGPYGYPPPYGGYASPGQPPPYGPPGYGPPGYEQPIPFAGVAPAPGGGAGKPPLLPRTPGPGTGERRAPPGA